MGWFDDIIDVGGDVFGGLFGGGDGGGGFDLGDLVGLGTNIYDLIEGPRRNRLAAEKIRESQTKAADLRAQGAQAGADELVTGYGAAATQYAPIIDAGGPALGRLMTVAAGNPYQLTPEQRLAQEDMQRRVNNQLATGGLRGAGRAGAAVFNDATRRQEAQFFGDNMRRGDAANSFLAQQGISARDKTATISKDIGRARAGAKTDSAKAYADAEETSGSVEAGADLASARARGSAIGGIGSIIAGDSKSYETRRPRYEPGAYIA